MPFNIYDRNSSEDLKQNYIHHIFKLKTNQYCKHYALGWLGTMNR